MSDTNSVKEIRDEVLDSLKKNPEITHYVILPTSSLVNLLFNDELIPAGVCVLTYRGYISLISDRLVATPCKVFFHASLLTKHQTVRQIGKTTSIISKVTAKAECNPETTHYIVFASYSEVEGIIKRYEGVLPTNIEIMTLTKYNKLLHTAKLKVNSCVYHDHSVAE